MKVSILMNCFNGDKYLIDAVRSVLNQTYQNWELIFWDNNSNDNSARIIKSFVDNRIKYYKSKETTSLGEARAKAFKKVNGEILAFLDTDDIWFKEKLELGINQFLKNKNLSIVYSNTLFFNDKKKYPLYSEKMPEGSITEKLLTNYFLSLESVLINIIKIRELDFAFDKEFSHTSDFDIITRVSTRGDAKYVDQILSGWRLHEKNETFRNKSLFLSERISWHKKNIRNNIFSNYGLALQEFKINNISDLNIKKLFIFDLNSFKYLINHKFINSKNKFKLFISLLPLSQYIYMIYKLIKKYISLK